MTKAEEAYAEIRNRIELCTLEPGATFTEATLQELLGVGRTPLREALQRLDHEMLVDARSGSGIRISALSVDGQLRGLEVRRALESLAVTLTIARADDHIIKELTRQRERLLSCTDLDSYLKAVATSHELFITGADNHYLAQSLSPLYVLSRRFWRATITTSEFTMDAGKKHHSAILDAIMDGDSPAAQAATTALNDYLVDEAISVLTARAQPTRGSNWSL